jgi:2-methylcitrate dehydratase PrpD
LTQISNKSVTETLAEWVVSTRFEDVPEAGVVRVRERFIDTLGVACAGMSVSTGRIMAEWVRQQGARGDSTVLGADFTTSASYAALANAAAGHALEYDDIAVGSGHFANPMTAATLAFGEKIGASGKDVILGWMVGYEIIAQTAKVTADPGGNTLLNRGWFNQGFLPAVAVAAAASRMSGLDVMQTRMAMGHAASTMAGMLKNRGSDTKGFVAGNAAMHGIMAAELVALGFTANDEIMDGELGVARLLSFQTRDAGMMLDGLGDWTMATLGSTLRLHACCGASHWAQDALQKIVHSHSFSHDQIATIEVEFPGMLHQFMPYSRPQTGLEAKYSLEYGLVAIALDGRAGLHQYSDAAVQRPEARALMERIDVRPMSDGPMRSRVVVKLTNGDVFEETANRAHGNPSDPLTREEVAGKFHECAEELMPLQQREQVINLCNQLDRIGNVRELGSALQIARPAS